VLFKQKVLERLISRWKKNRGKFHGFPQTPKIVGRYKGDPRKAGDGVVEEGRAEAIPEAFFWPGMGLKDQLPQVVSTPKFTVLWIYCR